jgi:hypothetical protein
MRGAFAEWQPRYAEHGIPTFPVKDKVPCVRGWQHVGLPASQLALKFPEADVFGFQCGRSSRITIVDIDSKDERIVNEAVKIFGDSPVLWRTGSGNFAMPFRHNGEGRRIRPIANLPIDVLGAGYAVAPPSAGKRQQYEFLKGGLDQFSSLPSLQLPANENSVPKGKRDNWLFKRLLREVRACDDFDTLLDVARTLNAECHPPMSDVQVISKAKQAWKYETAGNNWVGKRARATTTRDEILSLSHFPAAGCLLNLLRVSHAMPGEPFAIDQVKTAGLLRWERNTIRTAIRSLKAAGRLIQIHYGKGKGDPHRYTLVWDRG